MVRGHATCIPGFHTFGCSRWHQVSLNVKNTCDDGVVIAHQLEIYGMGLKVLHSDCNCEV